MDASFFDEYNSLKKDFDAEKKITRYMEASGEFWIEAWKRLRKELNQALMFL